MTESPIAVTCPQTNPGLQPPEECGGDAVVDGEVTVVVESVGRVVLGAAGVVVAVVVAVGDSVVPGAGEE